MPTRSNAEKGRILIFLPDEDNIRTVCSVLAADCPDMPTGLAGAQQKRALGLSTSRKCIVSTNIAETSLTIPGIKYVVDSMLSKQMTFNPRAGLHALQVAPISKAQAVQGTGCAGRTSPGKCVWSCTEDAYENHTILSPVPAMAHSRMDAVFLKLHEMRFDDVLRFPFVDPPSVEVLYRTKEDLMDM